MQSPIVGPTRLTFNGIDVGNVQYVDGFMRSQFWQTINGNPAYTNAFSFSVAAPATINTGTIGITYQSGCQQLGILDQSFVRNQILSLLQSVPEVSPSQIVLFVTHNVALSAANQPPAPPATALGYHAVTGSAPQVYAVADYNTTGLLKARNTTVVSHELAEIGVARNNAHEDVPTHHGIAETPFQRSPKADQGLRPVSANVGLDRHIDDRRQHRFRKDCSSEDASELPELGGMVCDIGKTDHAANGGEHGQTRRAGEDDRKHLHRK